MQVSLELVTPGLAAEHLKKNRSNRRQDKATVDRYASAMERGEWRQTHQGIAFAPDGTLLDGQHRLAAIVKSRVSQMILVARDVDPAGFSVLDTGKRRSAGDTLRLSGATDVNHLSAALRYLYLFDTRPNSSWSSASGRLTNDQILELYNTYPAMSEYVRQARPFALSIGIISSACAMAMFATERTAPVLGTGAWLDGLLTGENLESGDPRLALRSFYMNSRHKGKRVREAREHVAVYIKASNSWLKGEKRKTIMFREDESMPKPLQALPLEEAF